MMPDGEITSAVAHNSQKSIESYQRFMIHDEFTPISFLHTGTAMFNTAFRPIEEWLLQPIYKQHCTPFDFHWVIGLSYRFPHHKTTFLAFHYLQAKGEGFTHSLDEEFIEYVSYPFYLAWLHIYGAICADTLHQWLSLCAGMTLPRFLVIRTIAGQGIAHANTLGNTLNITTKTIYRHIENAQETILSQLPQSQIDGDHNASRILNIAKAYSFFEFGSGQLIRKLPRRVLKG